MVIYGYSWENSLSLHRVFKRKLCGRFVAVLVCGRFDLWPFWMYAGGCVVGAHGEMELRVVGILVILYAVVVSDR